LKIEKNVLNCFRNVVKDSQKWTLWDSQYQTVEADHLQTQEKKRKWKRGTRRDSDENGWNARPTRSWKWV